VQLTGVSDVAQIANTSAGVVILKTDGTVGAYGPESTGTAQNKYYSISGLTDMTRVSAYVGNGALACGIKRDKTVWCWAPIPGVGTASTQQVDGISSVVDISVGGWACARKDDASVWCWGGDPYGNSPTRVALP
jgi:hypothetical protein